jgi:MFS family permease
MPDQPIKPAATQPEPPTRRWAVLALLGVAQLMVVLDVTIVNVALPSAQRALGFSTDSRQWVVTAYALAFGSLLLLGGKLGDLFGRKWTFVAGLIGFAGASALGGLSQSFGMLVAARALQGAFGALLAPSALALLAATFAGSPDRPKAFGIFGAIAGTGGSFGLLLGGALTQAASWRWCLYVNLVIAIPTAILALRILQNVRLGQTRHLDLPGLLTGAVGLFALVYGVSNAETHSWTATVTIVALAASVVLLTGFVLIERGVSEPLLPLGIPADRSRGGAYIALLLAFAGVFSVFLFLTFYLQRSLGYTPLLTGVAVLPLTAVTIVSATVAQIRLVPPDRRQATSHHRYGARRHRYVFLHTSRRSQRIRPTHPARPYRDRTRPRTHRPSIPERCNPRRPPASGRRRRSTGEHLPADRRVDRSGPTEHDLRQRRPSLPQLAPRY